MIKFRLDEVLEEKGKSAYWLAKETGMEQSQVFRMKRETSKGVRWDTLERICRALDCLPGDLIVMVDDKPEAKKPEARNKSKKV